jgi:hypothetical protein
MPGWVELIFKALLEEVGDILKMGY